MVEHGLLSEVRKARVDVLHENLDIPLVVRGSGEWRGDLHQAIVIRIRNRRGRHTRGHHKLIGKVGHQRFESLDFVLQMVDMARGRASLLRFFGVHTFGFQIEFDTEAAGWSGTVALALASAARVTCGGDADAMLAPALLLIRNLRVGVHEQQA